MSTQSLALGASRKRKDREGADGFRAPPEPTPKPNPKSTVIPKPIPTLEPKPATEPKMKPILKRAAPALPVGNRLLAGYLAHEFFSSGTLCGKPFPPALPADTSKPGSSSAQPIKPTAKAYADVARLMMGGGGAHLPGVFNPTQLASWLQMQ